MLRIGGPTTWLITRPRTVEVEGRPETTARKLDPFLWPQGRRWRWSCGARTPRSAVCLSGFYTRSGERVACQATSGCSHANNSCCVLRRLSSLSFARTQSDYHGANGQAQRFRCKRRAKRERRCSCERSGVRSLEMGDGLRTGHLPGMTRFSPTLPLPIGLRRRYVPRWVASGRRRERFRDSGRLLKERCDQILSES